MSATLILASASPRRSQLLGQLGVAHRIVPANILEQREPGESPEQCVQRLAAAKARAVHSQERSRLPGQPVLPVLPVLGADTLVVLDGELLGKPVDRAAALSMLAALSGRTHRVLSAVALVSGAGVRSALSRTEVRMRSTTTAEREAYWDTGEPRDKAGAYAIQGLGALFVKELRGSYSGVVGLPLFETAALLAQAGVPVLPTLPIEPIEPV